MSFVLLVSISIRVVALAWSLIVLYRMRDWRFGFLSAMLALMALRQALTLRSLAATGLNPSLGSSTELPGLLVSILALAAVFHLQAMMLEQNRAAAQLRRLEGRYRDLFEEAPLTYVITRNRDGIPFIEDCNRGLLELLGYTRQELIGRPLGNFYSGESRRKLLDEGGYEKALKGEFADDERQLVTKDGEIVETLLRALPERDAAGIAIGTRAIYVDVTERVRAESSLRQSRERLRKLAARLHDVREEERRLIAREIHDQLGQTLTGLKLDLSWLASRRGVGGEQPRQRLDSMIAQVDETIEAVRDLSSRLRPPILDDLGLVAAIEWQARDFSERFSIECDLQLGSADSAIDSRRATALFRIFQEALTNVARHSEATRAGVSLELRNGSLHLEISDNGKGIAEGDVWDANSLGLIGMRERAGAFGGRVMVTERPHGGTTVAVRMPL